MADVGSGDVKKVVVGGQKPAKKEKKSKAGADAASAGPVEMNPPPDFLKTRLDLFDRLKKKYDDDIAKRPREQITITLPDGSIKVGTSWETTPGEIAKGVSNSLYKRSVVARLDGDKNKLWDLDRPLEQSCKLELLTFDDEQGKQVFWHSSAHILGEACERRFGCSLCIGPPIDDGFYYEMALPGGAAVQQSDWTPLERIVTDIVKDRQRFERLEVTKQDLLDMFSYNKYKQYIISTKIPDGTSTTVYRNGPLIDLCRGPHVPDTGRIEAFSIMKNSASYWLGSQENDSLQRIYGVSFPDKKKMAEHKKFLEEAAKRDHRKLGKEQELFMFHELSPGSVFFLPHGTRIYNTLLEYLRDQYHKRDYQEGSYIKHILHHLTYLPTFFFRLPLLTDYPCRSYHSKYFQFRTVEDERPLGVLQGRHVCDGLGKGEVWPQAHELSRSFPHVWARPEGIQPITFTLC